MRLSSLLDIKQSKTSDDIFVVTVDAVKGAKHPVFWYENEKDRRLPNNKNAKCMKFNLSHDTALKLAWHIFKTFGES